MGLDQPLGAERLQQEGEWWDELEDREELVSLSGELLDLALTGSGAPTRGETKLLFVRPAVMPQLIRTRTVEAKPARDRRNGRRKLLIKIEAY